MIVDTPIGRLSNEGNLQPVTDAFRSWWKYHRHSGFIEDEANGYYMWNITPPEAWNCDCYRIEYAQTTGSKYHSGFLVHSTNPTGDAKKHNAETEKGNVATHPKAMGARDPGEHETTLGKAGVGHQDTETETKAQGGAIPAQETTSEQFDLIP